MLTYFPHESHPPIVHACYQVDQSQLTSSPRILEYLSTCWRVHASDSSEIVRTKAQNGGYEGVRLRWSTCDYQGRGFRTEIAQPWSIPRPKNAEGNLWGIADEATFPLVKYQWKFKVDDPDRVIGEWSGGAFIAQWHSERTEESPAPPGGSPVIGLLFQRSESLPQNFGYLVLAMKVREKAGACLPPDEALNDKSDSHAICFKRVARTAISEGQFHSVMVQIRWDKKSKPGSILIKVDGSLLNPIAPYMPASGGDYILSNKQNDLPNYLNLGFYVQSKFKRKYESLREKSNEREGSSTSSTVDMINVPSFCVPRRSIFMSITDFLFSADIDRGGSGE